MILPPEKLTAKEQQQVEYICQANSDLRMVYLLSQEFITLLKERRAKALDSWLKRARWQNSPVLSTGFVETMPLFTQLSLGLRVTASQKDMSTGSNF